MNIFSGRIQKYIFVWTLTLLLSTLFIPTLRLPLLADDYIWVAEIATYDSASQFFQDTFALSETDFRYRPLMPTGVWACYQITGPEPFCMHLASFILHFLNTLLVGNLGYLLTKNKWSGSGTALFFAVYFPHVVTVVWVSDLGNLLALFFMLITATLFWRAIERNTYLWVGVSLVTFLLAMISKESALALGPILVVWGGIVIWRSGMTVSRSLIGTSCAGYVGLTSIYLFVVNNTGLTFAFSGQGNYSYHFDLNALRNLFFYSLNLVWPTNVHVIESVYQNLTDIIRVHAGDTQTLVSKILTVPGIVWIGGGALATWSYAVWLLWKRQFTSWLALVWISLGILPVLFLAGHGERHLYVPSAGLSLLVGNLFFSRIGPLERHKSSLIIYVLVFVFAIGLNVHWSQERITNWQTAGDIAREVVGVVSTRSEMLAPQVEIWFAGVPADVNGAHLFGLGLEAALELGTGVPDLVIHRRDSRGDLPKIIKPDQFVFALIDNRLVDLTADYRQASQ